MIVHVVVVTCLQSNAAEMLLIPGLLFTLYKDSWLNISANSTSSFVPIPKITRREIGVMSRNALKLSYHFVSFLALKLLVSCCHTTR